MKANSRRKAKVVVQVPEYLIAAVLATIASAFAKQLGNTLNKLRSKSRPESDTDEETPVQSGKTGVELRLRQKDGSYKTAAEGTIDSSVVGDIINEISEG